MRLALKLTLVWVLAVTVVLSAQSSLHLHQLSQAYEEEHLRELPFIARSLADATAHLWSTAGRPAAEAYLRQTSAESESLRLAIVAEGEDDAAAGMPTDPMGSRRTVRMPLEAPAPAGFHLLLEGGRTSAERRVDALVAQQVVMTIVLLVVSALFSLALGLWLVGRPVEELVAQARRVATGDFRVLGWSRQRDEIGHLAREMNHMSEQLDRARERERDARRARTVLLEQLRHADRLSTVGKLASGVAHELGTPLNVVSGRASMIADDATAGADVQQNAAIIRGQCAQMAGIIRQLLDYSRRRALAPETTRLAELVEGAVHLLEPIAEEKGIELSRDIPEELTLEADRSKILQVLTNLVMNAIHAMPDGGTVRILAAAAHVDAPPDRRARGGDFIKLSVLDEGVGMDDETLAHIFEPFFTTKEVGAGTGLGLSVCHGIVREHGGYVEVQSQPGEGTRLDVYLPV